MNRHGLDMWARAQEMVPEAVAGALVVSTKGGWVERQRFGSLDFREVLGLLRAGEQPLFDEDLAEEEHQLEVVCREGRHVDVLVMGARVVAVLRLAAQAPIGAALGFSRQVVREHVE